IKRVSERGVTHRTNHQTKERTEQHTVGGLDIFPYVVSMGNDNTNPWDETSSTQQRSDRKRVSNSEVDAPTNNDLN
ncbi:unnamed protein product, partial [Citrullus colocynthis]